MTDTSPEAVAVRMALALEKRRERVHDLSGVSYVPDRQCTEAAAMLHTLAAKLKEVKEERDFHSGRANEQEDLTDMLAVKLRAAEAALATAREDALREAAVVAKSFGKAPARAFVFRKLAGLGYNIAMRTQQRLAVRIGNAILALIEKKSENKE